MNKKPQTLPYSDDNDISRRVENDDFWIKRLLKFATLAFIIAIFGALTYLLCYTLFVDTVFRQGVLNEIKDNAVGIILGGMAILGVNIRRQ